MLYILEKVIDVLYKKKLTGYKTKIIKSQL